MKYPFMYKDIDYLFKKFSVTPNCEVVYGNNKSYIYQIVPIGVIDPTEEYAEKIYNAYLNTVKSFPQSIQIITLKDNLDFSNTINKVKENMKMAKSEILKEAIEKYVETLDGFEKDDNLKTTKYYMVISVETSPEHIDTMYKNLKELGLKVNRVTNEEELKRLLRKSFLQC